jgi:hypothetical protein
MKYNEDKELTAVPLHHNGNNWETINDAHTSFDLPTGKDLEEAFLADCVGGDWGDDMERIHAFDISDWDDDDFEEVRLYFTAAELKSGKKSK